MSKVVVVTVTCLMVCLNSWADSPSIFIYINNDPDVNSLTITATTEWNRSDLTPDKRKKLADKNIFTRPQKEKEITRKYILHGKELTVTMLFPKPENGRKLNESTRVEVSIFKEKKLIFRNKYFGQHSAEFTSLPKSNIKFRGNFIRLYKVGPELDQHCFTEVRGVYNIGYGKEGNISFSKPSDVLISNAIFEKEILNKNK